MITNRLFGFGPAGSDASIFRRWSKDLHRTDIIGVPLPGHGTRMREQPVTSMSALVPALVDKVRPSLDLPFSIFGQGLGALIAFELTRALRREGLPQPTHLFLAEQRAPQLPKLDTDIHELDEPAFREELRRRLEIPQEVFEHPELMALLAPILRADFTLAETYTFVAEEPLDVRFVIFGGDDVESWREQTSASTVIETSPARMLETIGRELAVALER